jgi:hypothetical protein
MRSILRNVAASLLTAVGLGPLISKAIERWAERNGYLDDPTKGLHWLVSTIASVTDWQFFYPLISFFAGLVIGLWLDWIFRKIDANRRDQIIIIGGDMESLGKQIVARTSTHTIAAWPNCISDLVPELMSLLLRTNKVGLWTPPRDILNLNDGGNLLLNYLLFVGKLLKDGHLEEAKQQASSYSAHLKKPENASP